jgi:Cys-rich repeat protein
MAEPRRLKRAVTSGWLAGCCAVAVSLMLGAQAFADVTVTVDTTDGVQGGDLTLTMGVERAPTDSLVSGVQTDIVFDTTQIELIGICSNGGGTCQANMDCGDGACLPPCAASAGVALGDFTANLPDTVRPPDQPPAKRLRLAVYAFQNPDAVYEGDVATCTFHVLSDAQPGEVVSLTPSRLSASDPNTDAIPNVQVRVMPGMIKMATPTPTPSITPTPTPTIPCFVDQDCPRGQVCEAGVCVPAPTPTPTIACPDGICPDDLTCVDGICRDLRTPTPTPTPLPTCTTDQECVDLEGPGFHCRAGVCVPIRPCDDSNPDIDRKECRGVREACVDNTCECGGDCNLDGLVLGNETSTMVCVISGDCELSDCPAGDFNGDGEITGSELCLAITNLGLGCPAEGQPLIQDRTDELRTLDIGSATGIAGGDVTLGVSLGGGGEVATAQLDVLVDTSLLELPDPTTDCSVDPRLQTTEATFTFLPQTPSTPPGFARLRLFVGNTDLCKEPPPQFPLTSFEMGPLVSCKFRINPNAQPGTYEVSGDRLNIGDPRGAIFGSASTPGSVTVEPPPACTNDDDCPTGTHCRAGVCKPIVQCSGFEQCGTSGRDSCVQGICECAGDCDLNGTVTSSEIGAAVQIFGEVLPVSVCPAADQKGDGQVTSSEIGLSVTNFGLNCPTP